MQSLKTILSHLNIDDTDKYLSREFQKYGIYLAERLDDMPHKALYIKLAKNESRQALAEALSFVLDSNARSKARLFMWKLKELKNVQKNLPDSPKNS